MHILCFVEEPSAEVALSNIFPKLLSNQTSFQFIVFQGKQDLLDNLISRLNGYSSWLPEDWKILVLIDEDRQDCLVLKQQLEEATRVSGLISKSQAHGEKFQVINRIAIEELEAWFIGDVDALRQAYPRVPASLGNRQRFRDPDSVAGGTWEALESILQSCGYCPAGYPKIHAAQRISNFMDPSRNRSRSFQVLCEGLRAIQELED
jgi:hypothetical protein